MGVIEEIKNGIKNSDVDDVISGLSKMSYATSFVHIRNEIILLTERLKRFKKKELLGLTVSQSELSDIYYGVLEFIDDVQKDLARNQQVSSNPEKKENKLVFYSQTTNEVSQFNPLLLTVLFDVSKSMLNTLIHIDKPISFDDFIQQFIIRAKSFSKSKPGGEVLNSIIFSAFAHGFTATAKKTVNFLNSIGFAISQDGSAIEDSKVRNLLGVSSTILSDSPSLYDLDKNWPFYKRVIEERLIDMGLGPSALLDGFIKSKDQINRIKNRNFHKYSMILLVTDGKYDLEVLKQFAEIVEKCESQNILCAVLLINDKQYFSYKALYSSSRLNWNHEMRYLFDVASEFPADSRFFTAIKNKAELEGWKIEPNPKLFFQLNQEQSTKEIIELLLSPLSV